MPSDALETIVPAVLAHVSGGTTSSDQITAVLTQITSSIHELANNQHQSDPTQLLLMMMMMSGGGGGYVAAPTAGPPVVNVSTGVFGGHGFGGCHRGGSKKGW